MKTIKSSTFHNTLKFINNSNNNACINNPLTTPATSLLLRRRRQLVFCVIFPPNDNAVLFPFPRFVSPSLLQELPFPRIRRRQTSKIFHRP